MNSKQREKHEKFINGCSDGVYYPTLSIAESLAEQNIYVFSVYDKDVQTRQFMFWFDGTMNEFFDALSKVKTMHFITGFEITWHPNNRKFINLTVADHLNR